jgi:hypothetical protein
MGVTLDGRHLCISMLSLVFGVCAFAQSATISKAEAESLVQLVLRHEHTRLPRRYCSFDHLDKPGKPFVQGSYAFSAICDFLNSMATVPYGVYIVGFRTADVWDMNGCQFDFPELRKKRLHIQRRLRTTEQEKAAYREASGCSQSK